MDKENSEMNPSTTEVQNASGGGAFFFSIILIYLLTSKVKVRIFVV
jgi:hypothetical protein